MSYDLTLCMNLKNKAVTQYMDYGFNSVAEVGETEFAASDTGLKILSGDISKDEGNNIDWKVSVGYHSFGATNEKRIRRVHANMQVDGIVAVTIDTEQEKPRTYALSANKVSNKFPVPHSATTERTHKGKLYKITIHNQGNAYAMIESIEGVFTVLGHKASGVL